MANESTILDALNKIKEADGIKKITEALPAGTNAIGKLAANSGVDIGDVDILSIAAGDNNIGNMDIVTMPAVVVSGALDTVKASGIARQTNPTPVGDGDNQRIATDDLGRQLVRPVQVRDLIATAYVAVSTGTETTLLAASAGVYHDLIYVLASNGSTVAVGVDLRAVTAGNIQMHLEVPANGVVGVSLPVPLPAMLTDGSGNNWTVDLPDITGTTVYLSALFSKEI